MPDDLPQPSGWSLVLGLVANDVSDVNESEPPQSKKVKTLYLHFRIKVALTDVPQ